MSTFILLGLAASLLACGDKDDTGNGGGDGGTTADGGTGHGGTDGGTDSDPDDAQQVIQAAAVAGRSAVRRGRRARRVQVLGGRPYRLPPKCAHCDGYGLHAGVVIGARDREGPSRPGPSGCAARSRAHPWRSRDSRSGPTVVCGSGSSAGGPMAQKPSSCPESSSSSRPGRRLAALVPPPRANTVRTRCGATRRTCCPVGAPRAGAAAWAEAIAARKGGRGPARQEAVGHLTVGAMGLVAVACPEPVHPDRVWWRSTAGRAPPATSACACAPS